MIDLLGSLIVLSGAFFLLSAGLGVLRMPDPLSRIQAGTKATTLGTTLILSGLAIMEPGWAFKLVLIVWFVFVSNPVSSHALASVTEKVRIGTAANDRDGAP